MSRRPVGWSEKGRGVVQLENSLVVSAPPTQVWEFLLDVERVAPCMPGAELTEVVDDRTWRGKVTLKLGPVTLAFFGTVVMQEEDRAGGRVVLKADGKETRGKGSASAVVTARLEAIDGEGTRVTMLTELTISGTLSQYGRGMIADVSQRLTNQFAQCVRTQLASAPGEAPRPPATHAVGGISLGLWALFRAAGRLLTRMWRILSSPFRHS